MSDCVSQAEREWSYGVIATMGIKALLECLTWGFFLAVFMLSIFTSARGMVIGSGMLFLVFFVSFAVDACLTLKMHSLLCSVEEVKK